MRAALSSLAAHAEVLAVLARDAGEVGLAERALALCSQRLALVIVTIGAEAHANPQYAFVENASPEPKVISLETLAAQPDLSLRADRLIVVLKAGELLDSKTLQVIERDVLSRPMRSTAIVVTA